MPWDAPFLRQAQYIAARVMTDLDLDVFETLLVLSTAIEVQSVTEPVVLLVTTNFDFDAHWRPTESIVPTIAQICDHVEQAFHSMMLS